MPILPLQQDIIYGPVNSRRLGRSLGINILPLAFKLCTFDCVYCQYGCTSIKMTMGNDDVFPSSELVAERVEESLNLQPELHYITFSGNGEPTLHPEFERIVGLIKKLRDKYAPNVPLAVLSNSSSVHKPAIQRALLQLDKRIMKLDAGEPVTYRNINRPCVDVHLYDIVEGLRGLGAVTLQTMMVGGKNNNVHARAREQWLEMVRRIGPIEVQLYSITRPVAEPGVEQVPLRVLKDIAAYTTRRAHMPVNVY